MAIQVQCPGCDQQLRVPDDAAGKKAKCPKCEQIVQIPTSEELALNEELGSDDPFATQKPAAAQDAVNPFESPTTVSYDQPVSSGEGGRNGPPWEQLGKSAKTFWETSKGVLLAPADLFSNMRRTGGLGNPIIFMLVGGLIGGVIGGLFNGLLQGFMVSALQNGPAGMPAGQPIGGPAMVGVQIGGGLLGGIVGGTIGNLIGSFIGAGIMHVMLLLFKGTNRDFETTYRVVAYTLGATALLNVVPFLGGYVAGIWALVAYIIGLAKAHETTYGKSAAAVLVPTLICCGLMVVTVALFVGSFAAFAAQ